jgi:cyclopropane-fatty-acyl-phospholipid synthase
MPPSASHFVPESATSSPTLVDRWALKRLAQGIRGARVQLRLWNGYAVLPGEEHPLEAGTVVIHDRGTLLRLLTSPDLAFGEGYSTGRITIEGDLVEVLADIDRALARQPYQRPEPPPPGATRATARYNIHAHYDLGNDFYAWWLDASMAYTCAYFERPDATLEEAQRAKFDYVCRKVELKAGDTVIEAGCGWGGLALFMAREYGVTVRAFNISREQLAFARARAAREGLSDRVSFIENDYRAIDGQADVFLSVGMLEHVGRERYAELGDVMHRVLHPAHGRGLLHFIGRNRPMTFSPWITKYVFPGAHAPSLPEVLPSLFETHNFSVLDIENLRRHYALTLRHWRERFEQHVDEVTTRFDARFVRIWRLYLASAEAAFVAGDLQLFQIVFNRAPDNTARMTRDDLYRRADGDM